MIAVGRTRAARRAEALADWRDLILIGGSLSGCAGGERRGFADTPPDWERIVALAP